MNSQKKDDETSKFLTRHHNPHHSFHGRSPTRESDIDRVIAMIRARLRNFLRIAASLLAARNSLNRALRYSIIHRAKASAVRTAVITPTVAVMTDIILRRSHWLLWPATALCLRETGLSGIFDWLMSASGRRATSWVVVVVNVVLRARGHTRGTWNQITMMGVSHWSRDLCAG